MEFKHDAKDLYDAVPEADRDFVQEMIKEIMTAPRKASEDIEWMWENREDINVFMALYTCIRVIATAGDKKDDD